jgi:regulator of cell morphogenesis and NO signaling
MKMTRPNTVAELAIAIPGSIPVFQRLKIDYCCHGDQSIQSACAAVGLTGQELMTLIDREPAPADVRNWDGSTLTEIIRFVNETHHAYTRQSAETLAWMSKKVANRHGENKPEVVKLAALVGQLIDDLLPHMMKEEQILFPYVQDLEGAIATGHDSPQPFFGTARNPVRMMMLEHETVGELLVQIRAVTNDFTLPEDACTTFTAYYKLLQELETDLHNHIHVENNILFPRTIALEEAEMGAMAGARA